MNNKKREILESLLGKNILWIEDKIEHETYDYVGMCVAMLMARGAPPFKVYITSGGGNVWRGLDIYDLISTYPNKVQGIVAGYANSIAAVILQACTERAAFEHAHMMIHHVSTSDVSLDMLRSKTKYREKLRAMEKDQDNIYRILSQRTGKSVREIRATCKKSEHMSSSEAKAFGLIDSIVPPHKIEP